MGHSEEIPDSDEKETRTGRRLTIADAEKALSHKLTPLLKVKSVTFEEELGSRVVIECQKHGKQPARSLDILKKGILCRPCAGKPPLTKATAIRDDDVLLNMLEDKSDENLDLSSRNQTKKLTWVCEKRGHHFPQTAYRLKQINYECPKCKKHEISIGANYPELAKEFHEKKNGVSIFEVAAGNSRLLFYWRCSKNARHEWEATPNSRIAGHGCPYCSGRKFLPEDSFQMAFPKLMEEWDWERNTEVPSALGPGSDKKVHWICSKDPRHRFINRVANRTNAKRKGGCPICAGYQVDDTNNLSAVYPDVAKFWHPTKNGKLSPTDIFCRAKKSVWWKCDKGPDHEWQGTVIDRVSRSGQCLFCINQKVSVTNSLATRFPEIAAEWHPTKNKGDTPEATLAISGKKVWWQCQRDANHEWITPVAQRTSAGTECPGCLPNPKSKIEIEVAAELKLFFKDLDIFDDLIFIDGKKYMPDIKISSQKLIIEYDGWFWHKDKVDKDIKKTEIFNSEGWSVIRLREKPLQHLGKCILFDAHDKKASLNELFLLLVKDGYLDADAIDGYLKSETLMNNQQYFSWLDDAIAGNNIFKSMRKKKRKN